MDKVNLSGLAAYLREKAAQFEAAAAADVKAGEAKVAKIKAAVEAELEKLLKELGGGGSNPPAPPAGS